MVRRAAGCGGAAPAGRTATDAKRKIEDGEAAAYERMSDKDYDTHFLRVAVGKGKESR